MRLILCAVLGRSFETASKTLIKEADAIFDRHLATLKTKGPKS
jgi:hypothetical protein